MSFLLRLQTLDTDPAVLVAFGPEPGLGPLEDRSGQLGLGGPGRVLGRCGQQARWHVSSSPVRMLERVARR